MGGGVNKPEEILCFLIQRQSGTAITPSVMKQIVVRDWKVIRILIDEIVTDYLNGDTGDDNG